MKRFLFLILFVLGVFICVNAENVVTNAVDTVYQDGKAAVTTLYSDAKGALNEVYPDVKAAVMQIGKAIGVAAEHVYTVLVKKYFVLGIKNLCTLIAGIFLFLAGYINWNRVTKDKPITYKVIMPGLLMAISLFMICSINYDEMFMGLINPEYGAINYILEYTKNVMK